VAVAVWAAHYILAEQFPHLRELSVRRLRAHGSTNALFRLGDELLVRMPRQPGGGRSIESESRWVMEIAAHLPASAPQVVEMGEPTLDFPEAWSIVRWLEGKTPTVACGNPADDSDRTELAEGLADVILALRNIDVPTDTLALKRYRGLPLADYDGAMRNNIEQCRHLPGLDLDLNAVESVWQQALELPGVEEPATHRWFHGDLVAENLLLTGTRLTSVLDFGGLGVGDPTIDLHGAWELFDPQSRKAFRTRLAVDEPEWLRGRAWALAVALMTFPYYLDTMPTRVHDRLVMAQAVLADAAR
jgi:aminoglycoside phosphotransferase (APT) family kinase protein